MMVRGAGKRLTALLGGALLLSLTIGALDARAWWDEKWQYRKKISFDTTEKGANITENLAQVPVLVRLHSGTFAFENAKEDGSDIRFVGSDDKTPLKYHLEKFDRGQGIAMIWVKVPQLSGASAQDHVWLYYGNSSVPDGADAGGTYDTAQAMVLHFADKEGLPRDSTAYGNHAAEFTGALGTPAIIGNGASFGGKGERLVIKRSPSLDLSKGFTFSAWVKPSAVEGNNRLFSWDDGKQAIVVGLDQGAAYARVGETVTEKTAPLAADVWQHLAVTVEPGKKVLVFLNGAEAVSAPFKGTIPSPVAEMVVGDANNGGSSFAGELDEVQIASAIRPAGWFAAAFAGQGPDGKLTAVLDEEAGGGGESGQTVQMMKIIAQSVTFDGWLVISLCSGMLMLASFVFIRKNRALRLIRRGNTAFLETFNDLHDPLDMDVERDDLEDSSLFRIYRAGYNQIFAWAEKHGNGQEEVPLPASAVNIFRAALERASSDETRKLNAGMIVLTLSISGGPFWGLLGTVWGVMNTFAGLAAAGEANLSAIAPGVASALACTLFGLFVAIPSLFGYSILVAQMKNLNADTRHFIEEFHLRVEGFHGEE
jgi:biopolymer transport protein ExbB